MRQRDLCEITDAIVGELVPMPPDAPDVCPFCRTGKDAGAATCRSCEIVRGQVSDPCKIVIPVSYYRTPSPLRERMHDYKQSPDPLIQLAQSKIVAGILARYIDEHGEVLADAFGDWDEVVAVPSTNNSFPSALVRALAKDYSNLMVPVDWLTVGTGAMQFNQASESGFVPVADLGGTSVLLIDDTFTTGARMHSAAHALQSAGVDVIAGLVVARKINPDPKYFTDELWDRQNAIPFAFTDPPWWAA